MVIGLISFLEKENLLNKDHKILLSVSGGIDSMVMAHLFNEAGCNIGIAHCNFSLRGKDSDLDEALVRKFAEENKLPFHHKRFDTEKYASEKGISIQMAARELRIGFSEDLLEREGYDCYATAHHLDDQLETFFINLLRGTGIAGLHGILPRQGNCIHPLMFAWRSDIKKYAEENRILFREDHTNAQTKYIRNKVRHILVPAMISVNSDSKEIITRNIMQFREAEKVYWKEIERVRQRLVKTDNNRLNISFSGIHEQKNPAIYLYEIIRESGFDYSQAEEILKEKKISSGKQFFSKTHRMLLNRDEIIVTPILSIKDEEEDFDITAGTLRLETPIRLMIEKIPVNEEYRLSKNPQIADLDVKGLTFPLTIRRWKEGDSFYPLGMKHRKKLSDFFIDNKFSLADKENAWLLVSGRKIAWIIGHRIDDRFRVKETTREVVRISLQK